MKKLLIFLSGITVGILGIAIYELFGRPVEPTSPENYEPDYKKDIQFSFTKSELEQLADGLNPKFIGEGLDFEEVIVPLAKNALNDIRTLEREYNPENVNPYR